MREARIDTHRAGDRRTPADYRCQRGRRMHRNAMRLHVSRDAHMLIRRIGNHQGCVTAAPAVNKVIVREPG